MYRLHWQSDIGKLQRARSAAWDFPVRDHPCSPAHISRAHNSSTGATTREVHPDCALSLPVTVVLCAAQAAAIPGRRQQWRQQRNASPPPCRDCVTAAALLHHHGELHIDWGGRRPMRHRAHVGSSKDCKEPCCSTYSASRPVIPEERSEGCGTACPAPAVVSKPLLSPCTAPSTLRRTPPFPAARLQP